MYKERIERQLQEAVRAVFGLDMPVTVWYDKTRGVYASNIAFELASRLASERSEEDRTGS